MYLTLCINAENRDEGVEYHSEGTQQKTRPHSTEVRQSINQSIYQWINESLNAFAHSQTCRPNWSKAKIDSVS